jgi:hypothetical protein
MVETQSNVDFDQFWKEVKEEYYKKIGNKNKVDEFVDYCYKLYKPHGRVFMPHRMMWQLYVQKKRMIKDNQHLWFLFVGRKGGEGKSTLAKHVLHFMDPSFAEDVRVVNSYKALIDSINTTKFLNNMKNPAILMDEADPTIHMASKEGTELRKILTKVRQLNLTVGMCVNDLSDVPSFIYKLFTGLIFLDNKKGDHRFWYWNSNEEYCGVTILDDIRKDYSQIKHAIFKKKAPKAIIGHEKFGKDTPYFNEKEYLLRKRRDIHSDMQKYLFSDKNNRTKRDRTLTYKEIAKKMYSGDYSGVEIAELLNVKPETIYKWIHNR